MPYRLTALAGTAAILLATACSSGPSKISVKVVNWSPEGSNHVAAIVRYTNNGGSSATALCTIAAYDAGGTEVGDDTDGPADKIKPGQFANIRLLIKTSINSNLVAGVHELEGTSCTTV
jgi:hypothetical protein